MINRGKGNFRQNHFSQHIQSQLQNNAYSRNNNPEYQTNLTLQKIIASLPFYKPLSTLVPLQHLRKNESQTIQVRKHRQSVYWGSIIQNKRSGKGILIYTNGRIYQGDWIGNQKNGKGYEKFSNASMYQGHYVNGKPQGCGRYQWPNGEIYEGEWKNGVKHGSGVWRNSKGDSYIGQWKQGKADGYGVHTWNNGDRYEGEFKDCLKHGEGVQRFANGDTYKGMYESGKPSGYGQYYWISGSFFKGTFRQGLRNGQGLWKKGPGHSDKYDGQWLDDKKHGQGVFTWAQGNVYRGNYQNDLRQGYGDMQYADGSKYKGLWSKDHEVDQKQELVHDQECQMFIPSSRFYEQKQQNGYSNNRIYNEDNQMSMPIPLFTEPQRPAILNSTSKSFRPRTLSKNTSRSQYQKSRVENINASNSNSKIGFTKKVSVGSVISKYNPYKSSNQKSLASSFYLYKIHGTKNQVPKSRQSVSRRQVKTSGGSRGNNSNVDEQLKYFARSKIGSYSQLS